MREKAVITSAQTTDAHPKGPGLRLDRWLWYGRFLKSRSLAAKLVETGRIRVNGEKVAKPSRLIRQNDVLTFPLGDHIRVIKIIELGTRRGPAPEAQALYEDLEPPQKATPQEKEAKKLENAGVLKRDPGQGRPTKRDRRKLDTHRDASNQQTK